MRSPKSRLRRRHTRANVLFFHGAFIPHLALPIAKGCFVTVALRLGVVVRGAVCIRRTDILADRVSAGILKKTAANGIDGMIHIYRRQGPMSHDCGIRKTTADGFDFEVFNQIQISAPDPFLLAIEILRGEIRRDCAFCRCFRVITSPGLARSVSLADFRIFALRRCGRICRKDTSDSCDCGQHACWPVQILLFFHL